MNSNLPNWISGQLSPSDMKSIAEAIKTSELTTSGEIVPVIVRRSSTIGHIPLILLPMSFLLGLFILGNLDLNLPQSYALLINIVFSMIITRVLSPIAYIERLLTPRSDQEHQVTLRAKQEFYESHIQKTKDQTGILIFVSLMERRVVVLGDKTISDKLDSATWNSVIDKIISSIKSKNLSDGVHSGIQLCGEILSNHFPIQPDDTNELPNELIIKEL